MTTYEPDLTQKQKTLQEAAEASAPDRLIVDLVGPSPAVRLETQTEAGEPSQADRVAVRTFDLVAGATALVVAAPVMALVGLAIFATSGGPVIYRSRRYTAGGREFEIWKFRSMCRDADDVLGHHLDADPALRIEYNRFHKLENDPRITPLGALLRRTSLDELPQLLNVVKGDMSLVGPRPMLIWERSLVGDAASELFTVKSGVTGAWQVSGRSDVSFMERIEMELDYVRHRSLLGDLKILIRTFGALLRRGGAC